MRDGEEDYLDTKHWIETLALGWINADPTITPRLYLCAFGLFRLTQFYFHFLFLTK